MEDVLILQALSAPGRQQLHPAEGGRATEDTDRVQGLLRWKIGKGLLTQEAGSSKCCCCCPQTPYSHTRNPEETSLVNTKMCLQIGDKSL